VDIGIQALSGALERGTDFLYICYDNEAYSNTGMQRSGATPLGARTTTTPVGKTEFKKDLDAIIAAHNPVYMATACSAYPDDLYKKIKKALSIPGPKFMHVLAPCPPGWRYPSDKTIDMGKLAVKSGMWLLYERENKKLSITGASKAAMVKRIPVLDYIKVQGRFKTATEEDIEALQKSVDLGIEKLKKEAEGIC
jgi:pyruvate ferredoxin oxidoreductase beta subunit